MASGLQRVRSLINSTIGNANLRGCQGIISALSISSEGMLAAGTLLREISLYSNEGSGECITSFSLSTVISQMDPCKGNGVSHLAWSPCGTYLFIAERQSDTIQVYDLRNTLSRVSLLSGRKAITTQRLGINIVPTAEGSEVWAGGTDGCVRMWKQPGLQPDEQKPTEVLQLHQDPVTNALWHPNGAVLATCSGRRLGNQRNEHDDGDSSGGESLPRPLDNRLKIWTVSS